jgi:hypothetical protein
LFLAFSFGWAVGQIVGDLKVANGGNSDWTFGQIVPLVVLAAPLIAIVEFCAGMSLEAFQGVNN